MGLKTGDVIVSIAGKPVKTPAESVAAVSSLHAGDRVEIVVRRGGKVQRLVGAVDGRTLVVESDLDVIYDQVVANGRRVRVI
ncbi:hypothetical protein C1X73_36110, partial [Pseudomonas sp. FW305-130]